MIAIEGIKTLVVHIARHNFVPEWNHEQNDDRKEHFDYIDWRKAEQAHNKQLNELYKSELMYFALRTASDVMVRRVFALLLHC